MRLYRPPHLSNTDTWAETHQVVIPGSARKAIISLAYDRPSDHLGIKKNLCEGVKPFFSGLGSRETSLNM